MKTEVARLRVSDPEKEILRQRAEAMGLTISDYIRYCCLISPPVAKETPQVIYIDEEHRQYYEARRCGDVYRDAVSYLMGLTRETRAHATDLFDADGMRIEGLAADWQTGSTRKVTRAAYNLWSSCMYESQEDYEAGRVSIHYGLDDLFCTGLAPYLWQAIRIRYPEYTQSE